MEYSRDPPRPQGGGLANGIDWIRYIPHLRRICSCPGTSHTTHYTRRAGQAAALPSEIAPIASVDTATNSSSRPDQTPPTKLRSLVGVRIRVQGRTPALDPRHLRVRRRSRSVKGCEMPLCSLLSAAKPTKTTKTGSKTAASAVHEDVVWHTTQVTREQRRVLYCPEP